MTQLFTGIGLGTHGSSLGQLGSYGPKGSAGLGQGGVSLAVNMANGNGVLKQSDGFLADFGVGLDLFQSYNTQNGAWRFNTDTRVSCEGRANTAGSVVTRTDEDGHQSRFVYDATQHIYFPQDGGLARLTFDGASWLYREGSGLCTCHYNLAGQLTRISDRDGHALQFHYDQGLLTTVEDNSREQSVTWSFQNGLLRDVMVTSQGQPVHHLAFAYDAQHRLNRVARDLGDGKTYWIAYDYAGDSNLINGIRQSDGTHIHLDYDAEGRIRRLVDGEGRTTTYDYQMGKTVVTNGLGESWSYYYDAEARLTGIDGPALFRIRYHYNGPHLDAITQGSQHWAFQYNEAGDCVRMELPTGEVTQRMYDTEHRLLSETRQSQITHFVYDEKGHLRFEMLADGVVKEHRYDADGNRINSRCYMLSRWQEQDRSLAALLHWSQQQNPQSIHLVEYRYDFRGDLSEEIHYTAINDQGMGIATADALRTYSRYDAAGRLVEQSSLTKTGLSTTHFMYDDLGRLIQTMDNQHHTQAYTYDDAHQRILKTDANGLQTFSIYDKSGLLLSTHRLDTTHDFGTVTYEYDAAGRLIAETDATGNTRYQFYDARGLLQASLSVSGHVIEYQYDDEDHCIQTREYDQAVSLKGVKPAQFSTIKPNATNQDRISQVVYNASHQIAYQIDSEGAVIGYAYDLQGRVIVAGVKGHQTTYYYDINGRLQAQINAFGAAMAYRYDAEGHLLETTRYQNKATGQYTGDWSADAPVTHSNRDIHTYSLYNAAGLKVADIDAEHYLTEYTYDARGLLIDTMAYYTPLRLPVEMTTLDAMRPTLHTNDHHTIYRYNDLNQCIEEKTQSGLVTRYVYNAEGHLIRKTVGNRQTTTYQYDTRGLLLHVDGPEHRTTDYAYDLMGRLTQQDTGGRLNQFTYDAEGRVLTKVVDPDGLNMLATYTYDAFGQQVQIIDSGRCTRFRYDSQGRLIETCLDPDGLNLITAFNYNEYGELVRETHRNPQGVDKVIAYTRDALGRCETQTVDPDGLHLTTTYAYDVHGNVVRQTDPNQHLTQFIYDANHQVRYRIDARGSVIEHRYDGNGCEQETIGYAHRVDGVVAFDEATLVTQIQADATTDHHQRFEFDADNRLIASHDGLGHATSYRYDGNGNVIEKTQHDLTGPSRTTYFAYDGLNQERFRVEGNGRVTESRYDAAGLLIQQTRFSHALHLMDDYSYDAIQARLQPDVQCDESTYYAYDKAGRLTQQASAAGVVTAYTWDAAGNQTARHQFATPLTEEQLSDPDWQHFIQSTKEDRITRSEYDAAGRERYRISPTGHVVERCYDAVGNVITEINLARLTQFHYDAAGRLTRQSDALNQSARYTYDANNNVASQQDANSAMWTYRYNESNQLIETRAPMGCITQNDYDAFGNITTTIRDAGGLNQTTEFTYDANNHLLQTAYLHVLVQEAEQTQRETNVYNAFGERIEHRDRAGLSRYFVYDILGQQTQRIDAMGFITQYDYDAFGNMCTQTQTDRHVYYAYDKDHRLTEQRKDTVLTYNPRTGKYALLPPTTRITYTVFGEVLTQSVQLSKTDWATTTHRYNADGLTTATLDAESYLTTYRYNAEGLLADEIQYANRTNPIQSNPTDSANDRHVSFLYNAMGYMTEKSLHAVRVSRLTGNGSEYETTTRDLVSRYGYDALGHLVSTTDTEGFTAYSYYNAAGLLTSSVGADHSTLTYQYDALGQLLETHCNDVIRQNVYDAWGRVMEKMDGNGNYTHYRYDANGNMSRSWQASHQDKRYAYDNEHRLTQTSTFNAAGVMMTEDTAYNAFGEVSKKGIHGLFTTQIDYDLAGRVWRTNTEGKCQLYAYDLSAHVTQVMTSSNGAAGMDLSRITYQDIASLDADLLQRQDHTFDAEGRHIAQTQAGASRTETVDRWGNLLQHTNANGFTTEYEYNALNALTRQRLPTVRVVDEHGVARTLAPVIVYAIDGLGRTIAVTDANDHTVAHRFDANGRAIEDIDATGNARRATYDLFGNRIQQIDERGNRTSYTYDHENHLLSIRTTLTTQRYEYDEAGQLIRQQDAAGNIKTFAFDERGFQTQQTTGLGTTRFEYDNAGHKTAETDATGRRSTWVYDSQGRVTEHTDLGGHRTNYAYNINGLLVEETGSTGKHQTRTYFSNGQLQQYKDLVRQETVDYTYDAENQVTAKSSERLSAWAKTTEHYAYDAQGRLAHVNRENIAVDYEYDAVGNIRDTQSRAQYENYNPITRRDYFCYDANNRLIISKGLLINGQIDITQSQGTAMSYDATGNLHDTYVYEGVTKQHYQYDYNTEAQVIRIRRNDLTLQRNRFEGGLLVEQMVHNGYGNLTRQNRMAYKDGLLAWQDTFNENGAHVGSMGYRYDGAGNLTKLRVQACAVGSGLWYKETHDYGYALWDGYLQASDHMVYDMERCATTVADSTHRYDLNGLLENVTDTPTQTNTTDYYGSGLDGMVLRKDKQGETRYLTVNGKTLGDLRIDNATKNQTLTVYAESTATAMRLPEDQPGLYTVNTGDTLEQIALQVYGDRSLWYLIADANGITDRRSYAGEKGGQLHLGMRLKIPQAAHQRHTNDTHAVMTSSDWMGNTHPTLGALTMLSSAPPPNKHGDRFWKILASIAVVVIAAAAMMMSAGVLAVITTAGASFSGLGVSGLASLGISALGGTGVGLLQGIGIGFASGVTSNIAGQVAAVAFHQQNGIDFKSALMTGIATAATAGIAHGINTIPAYQPLRTLLNSKSPSMFNVLAATEMMERDAASQALNIALDHHRAFDWRQLGVSGVTAGIMGGDMMQNASQYVNTKLHSGGAFVTSEAQALLEGAVTGHYDAVQILQDNLGSAVAASVLQPGMKPTPSDEIEVGGYCPIPVPEEEETFSAIPEGTWERFHREQELRNRLQAIVDGHRVGDVGSSLGVIGSSTNINSLAKGHASIQTIALKDLDNKTPFPLVVPISDIEFTDKNSLTQDQIKEIIMAKNPTLINKYKAHEIIFNTAQKYEINPKALLASLKQEQGWVLNGKIDKAMGIGMEGRPEKFPFKASIERSGEIYRKWFDVGIKNSGIDKNMTLLINQGLNYQSRTAAEYSRLKYTPWTYYAPQKSRPYDQWVSYFRSF